MNLTGQKLIGGFCAAGAVMTLLFAGNRILHPPVSPAVVQVSAEKGTQPATLPTAPPWETEAPAKTEPPRDPRKEALEQAAQNMDGQSIFVYDTAAGEMLLAAGGETQTVYPASITKLFSAWVALKHLAPDTVVTAGEELALVKPGSSTAYIRKGHRLTVEMLVEAMLLPSGNDGAYVLAAAAGRAVAQDDGLGPEEAVEVFVETMNREAEAQGMTGSHFTNPDGYHEENHISCPEDLVKIGLLALENDLIARYAGKQQDPVTFQSGQWITWYNTNALLDPESPFYTEECLGLKTGFTGEAGYCLLAAFRREEGVILMGIFGAKSGAGRYRDAKILLDLC